MARIVAGLRRIDPVATARRCTSGFVPISTIFAIASGNASRGISSCGLCQRTDAGRIENEGRATRAHEAFVKSRCRTRKELSTMRGRPPGCVRMGCARTKGWERRPPRGLLETILSPRHRELRDTIREGEKERRNMIRRKTAVAVLIAVIVGR